MTTGKDFGNRLAHEQSSGAPATTHRILKFVSRAEHLAWRERWKQGRFIILSPSPEQRQAILQKDEEFRQADERWALNHRPIPKGAKVLGFPQFRKCWTNRE